jgi:hypothetical protein
MWCWAKNSGLHHQQCITVCRLGSPAMWTLVPLSSVLESLLMLSHTGYSANTAVTNYNHARTVGLLLSLDLIFLFDSLGIKPRAPLHVRQVLTYSYHSQTHPIMIQEILVFWPWVILSQCPSSWHFPEAAVLAHALSHFKVLG